MPSNLDHAAGLIWSASAEGFAYAASGDRRKARLCMAALYGAARLNDIPGSLARVAGSSAIAIMKRLPPRAVIS